MGRRTRALGRSPRNADIGVGYLHDWTVFDRYGYGSDHQPRVESVTVIVIKEEFSATIDYKNNIQMIAKGSLSGTAGVGEPWPQQGEYDVALTAIDIHGKQHRLNISARATAMLTNARTSLNSKSSTSKWTVSGGVSVSSGGPSGSIGGSYEETETVSSSQTKGTSVPAVASATYNKDYSDSTTKTVRIECGGTSTVSRAAQINGHFYTKSFSKGGSVHTTGTHGVSNTLDEDQLRDPDFDLTGLGLGEDRIPLVIPDVVGEGEGELGHQLVPVGYLHPDSWIEPDADTKVTINPGSNLVTIDGGFWVGAAQAIDRDFYQAGPVLHFRPGGVLQIDGFYEIVALDGTILRVEEGDGVRVHQLLDAVVDGATQKRAFHGQVVEDLAKPGTVVFSEVSDLAQPERAVLPDLDLCAGSVRKIGGALQIGFRADLADASFILQKTRGLGDWEDVEVLLPEQGDESNLHFLYPIDPAEPSALFRVTVAPEFSRLLSPLREDSLDGTIERLLIALAETPEDLELVLSRFIYPMFDLSIQIRDLEIVLASGALDPVAVARVEVNHALLMELREELRRARDRYFTQRFPDEEVEESMEPGF